MNQAADICYAKSGNVSLAYQAFGAGDRDLVLAPGYISNLEANWEEPNYARFLERLAARFRVVLFDKRGTGLSDRIPAATLEERADDVRAVMDAAAVERGALLGWSEGGSYSAFFAAREPERVSHLILYAAPPRILRTDDYRAGWPVEMFEEILAGTEATGKPTPSQAGSTPVPRRTRPTGDGSVTCNASPRAPAAPER